MCSDVGHQCAAARIARLHVMLQSDRSLMTRKLPAQ